MKLDLELLSACTSAMIAQCTGKTHTFSKEHLTQDLKKLKNTIDLMWEYRKKEKLEGLSLIKELEGRYFKMETENKQLKNQIYLLKGELEKSQKIPLGWNP